MNDAPAELTKDDVLAALSKVLDPRDGGNIVDSGLVTGVVVKGGKVGFTLDIGAGDPREAEPLRLEAEAAVKKLTGVLTVSALVTAEREAPGGQGSGMGGQGGGMGGGPGGGPASGPGGGQKGPPPELGQRPAEPAEPLVPGAKAIIAVASGKGGVGKSTVAVNLALGLKALGLKVGLMDADIYGPSVPKMLGLSGRPHSDGKKVTPIDAGGLKTISMGFLLDEHTPMIWRGPMVAGAVSQLLGDVDWGELDVLVVDMPPGTGDAQLTLAQKVPMKGAVIVSTPQDIALVDARKGIAMFQKVNVPILGVIENMSVYVCPHCGETSHIFGEGGARATAKALTVPFLGEIPLSSRIRELSDAGTPPVTFSDGSPESAVYLEIARKVAVNLGYAEAAQAGAPSGS